MSSPHISCVLTWRLCPHTTDQRLLSTTGCNIEHANDFTHSSRPTCVLTEPKKLHWWTKPPFLFSSLSFLLPSTLCFQHHRAYDIWYKSCWWRNPLPKSLLIPPALGIFPLHSIQVTTQELHASPPHFQISPFQETHSKSNIDITYILVMYLFLKRPLPISEGNSTYSRTPIVKSCRIMGWSSSTQNFSPFSSPAPHRSNPILIRWINDPTPHSHT